MNYHDEFGCELGFRVDFTIEIIVLFDPIHRTDRNRNAIIASGTIIVSDDQFID